MVTLQDKVIVITGSTRGLGLAIARACTAEGAHGKPAAMQNAYAATKSWV
jgi:NADP-dependent 3-hydroxy acid dehydrogenase YdfG